MKPTVQTTLENPFGWSVGPWTRELLMTMASVFEGDSQEELEAFLARPDLPDPLFRHDESFSEQLYTGKGRTKQDPRVRLLGHIHVTKAKVMQKLAADPNAAEVVGLSMRSKKAFETFLQLTDLPFPRLRRLRIDFAPSPQMLQAMAEHPALQQMEQLMLYDSMTKKFEALAAIPWLPRLRSLALAFSLDKARKDELETLAKVPFETLRGFDLTAKDWDPKPKLMEPIVAAPWLPEVRYLGLSLSLRAKTNETEALAKNLELKKLRRWNLSGHWNAEILRDTLRSLEAIEELESPPMLKVDGEEVLLGVEEARALCESGQVPVLGKIRCFGEQGQEALRACGSTI